MNQPQPLDLDNVRARFEANTAPAWRDTTDIGRLFAAIDQRDAELRRLTAELAQANEKIAAQNPRLRCLLIKDAPDVDLYIGWSTTCEMPVGLWTRLEAIAYGFPPSRLDRADQTGTSSYIGDGAWADSGFIAEQRGFLRRDRLGDYAVEWLVGDREAAYALLEPLDTDDETTTPATVSGA